MSSASAPVRKEKPQFNSNPATMNLTFKPKPMTKKILQSLALLAALACLQTAARAADDTNAAAMTNMASMTNASTAAAPAPGPTTDPGGYTTGMAGDAQAAAGTSVFV